MVLLYCRTAVVIGAPRLHLALRRDRHRASIHTSASLFFPQADFTHLSFWLSLSLSLLSVCLSAVCCLSVLSAIAMNFPTRDVDPGGFSGTSTPRASERPAKEERKKERSPRRTITHSLVQASPRARPLSREISPRQRSRYVAPPEVPRRERNVC